MKLFGLLVVISCLISCSNKNILKGYYYMEDSYDLYNFNKDQAKIFDILDSTTFKINYKILDEDIINIDQINYHYENLKDSLIIHGFPENYSSKQKSLKLIKFNFEEEISIEDLNNKSWSMVIEKFDGKLDKNINETQILSIKDNLKASYIKNNDTILGAEFTNNGKLFNKFIGFTRGSLTILIPIELKSNQIKFLYFSGFDTNKIFTLNEIKTSN